MADTSRTMEAVLGFRDALTEGLKKAENSFQAFGKKAGAAINDLPKHIFNLKTALAGLVGALAAREAGQFVERVAKYGDSLNKLNQKTGLTVEFLSKLKYAGEASGLSLEEVSKGILNFQKLLFEFRRGTDEAVETFSMLGGEFLNAAADATTAEQAMPALIDAFSKLTSAEERVVVATKLFKQSGAEWIPLLSEGGRGFKQAALEASRFGLVLTKAEATAGTTFVDAIDRLKNSIFGLGVQAITPLLPSFTAFLDRMTDLVVKNQPQILTFFASLLEAAEGALPKIHAWLEGIAGTLKSILGPAARFQEEMVRVKLGFADQDFQKAKGFLEFGFGSRQVKENAARDVEEKRKARDELQRELDELLALRASLESGKVPAGRGGGGLLGQTVGDLRRRAAELEGARQKEADGGGEASPRLPGSSGASSSYRTVKPNFPYVPTALDSITKALDTLTERWKNSFKQFEDSVLAVGNSLEDNLSGSLADVITGTQNLKEASKALAKSMLQDLARIISRMLVMRALGGVSSLFSGGERIGPPAIDELGHEVPRSAIGTPRTFGPTLAGEAGEEAIIPLPGNRRVPVQLLGGGGGITIINYTQVTAMDAKSFDEKVRPSIQRNGDLVAQVAARGFQNRPDIRRRYS